MIIGITNRMMTAAFCRTPRIICSLTFTFAAAHHRHLLALLDEDVQVDVEEPAEEQREEADDDVGDRRGEVRSQLLAARSRGCYARVHVLPSTLRVLRCGARRELAAACGVSSVVTCRKISSRLMRIGRSSSSPHPPIDDRAGELAADVGAALALDFEPAAGTVRPPR